MSLKDFVDDFLSGGNSDRDWDDVPANEQNG
jgi:hypothetical protein